MKILILGGTGNAGRAIAKYLLQYSDLVEVVIASRNLARAKVVARQLNLRLHTDRASSVRLDVGEQTSLKTAFRSVDMVLVASSTMQYTARILEEAISAKVDYYDILMSSPEKLKLIFDQENRVRESGILCITDGGYHPGVPAAMVRYAREAIGGLTSAQVYAAMKLDWKSLNFSKETMTEFVQEFKHFDPSVYQEGKWQKQNLSKPVSYDFGTPFGMQKCIALNMREMTAIPEQYPEIRETGFYISGFNRVVDMIITPIVWMGIQYLPERFSGQLTKLYMWGLRFGKPPYGVQLIADCENPDAKLTISIAHEDPYIITAVPTVACLLQYLRGNFKLPGVYLQSWIVDPAPFFEDIKKMGVKIRIEESGKVLQQLS